MLPRRKHMTTADPLMTLVRDQKRWSLTANSLKAGIGRARLTILGLAVAGRHSKLGGPRFKGVMRGLRRRSVTAARLRWQLLPPSSSGSWVMNERRLGS